MNLIAGILSLIFLVLAILVIRKSGTLVNTLTNKTEKEFSAVDSSNNWNGIGFLVFYIVGTILGVWSFIDSMPQMFRTPNSEHGVGTDNMFWISMSIVTLAFMGTVGLLFFFAFKYRYSKNRVAKFYPENHTLELIWTIVPAIVMAGLVFSGWKAWSKIMGAAPKEAVVIEIVGQQFGWKVRYAGVDNNKLGNFDFKKIDNTNDLGIDLTDENSFDDFIPAEMHIPKGVPVLLKIRAKDVLHSVFMPDMRVKMDAVPGMPTKFWFTATKTTDEKRAEMGNAEYNYKINCAEICGNGHFGMSINFYVDEPEAFNKWYAEQKSFLTMFPEYLEKVPEKLKAKAAKYAVPAPVEVAAEEAVASK
jgi:cytochrome c oxidase subunit II